MPEVKAVVEVKQMQCGAVEITQGEGCPTAWVESPGCPLDVREVWDLGSACVRASWPKLGASPARKAAPRPSGDVLDPPAPSVAQLRQSGFLLLAAGCRPREGYQLHLEAGTTVSHTRVLVEGSPKCMWSRPGCIWKRWHLGSGGSPRPAVNGILRERDHRRLH